MLRAGRTGQDRPGQLQQRRDDVAELGRTATAAVAVMVVVAAVAAGRAAQEAAAERTDLGRDELHLRRDDGRDQRLEVGHRLRRLDVVLLVLLNVRVVQLVNEARLRVDERVDFLLDFRFVSFCFFFFRVRVLVWLVVLHAF